MLWIVVVINILNLAVLVSIFVLYQLPNDGGEVMDDLVICEDQ